MRKAILTSIFTAFVTFISFAQIEPVEWEFASSNVEEDIYELVFTATIDEGWYIYSQFMGDDGPVPTSFEYDESDGYALEGEATEEGEAVKGYSEIFEMEIIKYGDQVVFKQKVKVSDSSEAIEGYLTFMSCDKNRCLPPEDVDFSFEF